MPSYEDQRQQANPTERGCFIQILPWGLGLVILGAFASMSMADKNMNVQSNQPRLSDVVRDVGIGGHNEGEYVPEPTPMAPEAMVQAVQGRESRFLDPETVRQTLISLGATVNTVVMVGVFENGIVNTKEAYVTGDPANGPVDLKITDSNWGERINRDTIVSIQLSGVAR